MTVVDVGCGTGLSFPWLEAAVGPAGRVVGVDASAAMLDRAAGRVVRSGWLNVTLVHAPADHLDQALADAGIDPGDVDAVVLAYALSVMSGWQEAWRQVVGLAAGTRVAIVDLELATGAAAALNPLWRLLCALGGSDPTRHPARRAAADLTQLHYDRLLGGHVTVLAGRLPRRDEPDEAAGAAG